MADVRIDVTIPSLLADCAGGRSSFSLEAGTLAGALEALRQTYPLLRHHMYDEQGNLRQHVVIFFNGGNTRWLDSLDVRLETGGRIEVLQAVSGG